MTASRTNEWLYIEFESEDPPQLFDVVADPSTAIDLAADKADVASEMAERLRRLREVVAAGGQV